MNYIKTKLATDWRRIDDNFVIKIIKILVFFIPRSNPESVDKLHLVNEWYIEFDDLDFPMREIGIDCNDEIGMAGPSALHYGYWLDTNMKISDFQGVKINSIEFESRWSESGVKSLI